MAHRNQLEDLIEQKNGLVLTKDVEKKGVPRHYLGEFVKEKNSKGLLKGSI